MSAPVDPGSRRGGPSLARGILILVVLVVLAVAAYFLFLPEAWRAERESTESQAEGSGLADGDLRGAERPALTPPGLPEAPSTEPSTLPAPFPPQAQPPSMIRDVQAFLDDWAERVSPRIPDDWLRVEDPFERAVAATNAIVLGENPMKQLRFLRPTGPFEPRVDEQGNFEIAPERMDRRYRRFLDFFYAIDPDTAAEAFRLAEPTLDRAHRELGYPAGRFRDVLLEAVSVLRATPIPEQPVALVAETVTYAYADEELEGLDPAQRMLLRLSSAERRRVNDQLAAIEASLSRLPE